MAVHEKKVLAGLFFIAIEGNVGVLWELCWKKQAPPLHGSRRVWAVSREVKVCNFNKTCGQKM